MARAAAPRIGPRASTGKGSAGGSFRISGRGGSNSAVVLLFIMRRTSSRDMARLPDLGAAMPAQYVVEVGAGLRRHGDPSSPAFGKPALRRGVRGALSGAVGVVVSQDDHSRRERQR